MKSKILNHRGEPWIADKTKLTEHQSIARAEGVRVVNTKSIGSSLTPEKVANIMKAANEGDIKNYLIAAEELEETSLHYASVLGTRKRAVVGLDVVIEANSDEAKDIEVSEKVQEIVSAAAFNDLVIGLLDALAKGFAVCEIVYNLDETMWMPVSYQYVNPLFFTFDKETRARPLLLQDEGEPLALDYAKYVYHTPKLKSGIPIRGGLARLVMWSAMCASYSAKDWMAFIEVYGMPVRLGRYPANTKTEDIDTLVEAVSTIASDSAAVIPETMNIEFVEAANSASGEAIFERAAKYFESLISKSVLGQTMTTDDGSSQSQANVHNNIRLDILEADAKTLAATIQRDLIDPFVLMNYGGDVEPPKITLPVQKPEDVKMIVDAVDKFVKMGMEVSAAEMASKIGLSTPAKGEKLLSIGGVANPPGLADKNEEKAALKVAALRAEKTEPDDLEEIEGDFFNDYVKTSIATAEDILEIVATSTDYEDCRAKLSKLELGDAGKKTVESLANSTFLARAFGDVKDG